MSIWMPLQEATIENGCLWFMPKSHEWEILPHHSIGDDPRIHGLELADTSVIVDPVSCPLKPGGITLHRNRTAHYAGPNTTDSGRRALILGYGINGRPYPVERRFPWNEIKVAPRQDRARAAAAKVTAKKA
jgi:ectoine hydroxylase-related dioxygenase (phytanoyl-CoA dioxygenase family)